MNPIKLSMLLLVALMLAFPIACTSSNQKTAPKKGGDPSPTPFNSFGGDGDGDGDSERSGDEIDCDDVVTYKDDIRDLMEDDCVSCHDNGGTRPYLEDYEDVEDAASKSLSEVKKGDMPDNAPEWSSKKIRLLEDWIEQGHPETKDDIDCEEGGSSSRSDDFDVEEFLADNDEFKECKADDRIFFRDGDDECCTVSRIADYRCNRANIIEAFEDDGIDLEDFLDKRDISLDDWKIDQCGVFDGSPVLVIYQEDPRKDNAVVFRHIRSSADALECR